MEAPSFSPRLIKNFKSNGFTDPKWIKRAKADVEAFYEDHEVVFISSDEEDNKLGSISAEVWSGPAVAGSRYSRAPWNGGPHH